MLGSEVLRGRGARIVAPARNRHRSVVRILPRSAERSPQCRLIVPEGTVPDVWFRAQCGPAGLGVSAGPRDSGPATSSATLMNVAVSETQARTSRAHCAATDA